MYASFFDLDFEELSKALLDAGFQKFRAKQIWEAVYQKKIFDFSKISNIPKNLRDWLNENYVIFSSKPLNRKISIDDTGKHLFELSDGYYIECVILEAPDDDSQTMRKTLCISTQVGCAQGCRFCASTLRGFKRNLTSAEIVSQILPFANNSKFDFENIVVMGMGEPLANFDNIIYALKIINERFNFGARRITVSTCGIADKILKLVEIGFPYRLAVSLHGATNEIREKIMPVNKKYPLEKLLPALEAFSKSNGRMITLEYILIDKVNDSFNDATELAKIALRLHAHVNLIPYNKVESLPWKRPDLFRRNSFLKLLKDKKVSATLRREKGSDIEAACGQLALLAENKKDKEI